MTRGMWAAWYSQAYQNRQSTLSQTDVDSYYKDVLNYFRQEEQKEEKDKSKQAYGPQRLSRVSGTERYVVTRAARQKLKDESLVRIQAQTADASRLKHDKTSQRAALWIKDNSKNIRRKEKSTVIRDLKKFDDYKARAKKPVVLDHKSFTPTRVSLENIAFEPTRETLESPSFGPTREVFDAGKSLQASQLQRRKKFDPTEQKPSAEATGKTQFGTQKEVAPERRRKSFDVVVPSKESSSVAPQSSKAPEVIHESQRRKRFR